MLRYQQINIQYTSLFLDRKAHSEQFTHNKKVAIFDTYITRALNVGVGVGLAVGVGGVILM